MSQTHRWRHSEAPVPTNAAEGFASPPLGTALSVTPLQTQLKSIEHVSRWSHHRPILLKRERGVELQPAVHERQHVEDHAHPNAALRPFDELLQVLLGEDFLLLLGVLQVPHVREAVPSDDGGARDREVQARGHRPHHVAARLLSGRVGNRGRIEDVRGSRADAAIPPNEGAVQGVPVIHADARLVSECPDEAGLQMKAEAGEAVGQQRQIIVGLDVVLDDVGHAPYLGRRHEGERCGQRRYGAGAVGVGGQFPNQTTAALGMPPSVSAPPLVAPVLLWPKDLLSANAV